MISHEDIFRTGIALLAFVVAFYAVIARERKTPYILNSIYTITYLVLVSLLLSFASKVVEPSIPLNMNGMVTGTNAVLLVPIPQSSTATGTNAGPLESFRPAAGTNPVPPPFTSPSPTRICAAKLLNVFSEGILAFVIFFIFWRLLRIQNRQVNFRDDQWYFMIPMLLRYRMRRQKSRLQPAYEHNPQKFPPKLIESLKASSVLPADKLDRALKHNGHDPTPQFSTSVAILAPTHMDADYVMAELAMRFLDNDCFVQYTTCSRHPIEFLLHLKREWCKQHKEGDWKTVMNRIVLVDGYTPHFGFTDTVYTEWSDDALKDCLACIVSTATYAGIHTAIANAFNKIKKQSNPSNLRFPTLVIYEGTHALVDLESKEQYRIFVRHVIPSERLWGGMLTLFVESSVAVENLAVLKEVTHIFVDRREKRSDPVAEQT